MEEDTWSTDEEGLTDEGDLSDDEVCINIAHTALGELADWVMGSCARGW